MCLQAKVEAKEQVPIKKLLRTISESKNMNSESLASRYTRIAGVVAAYWLVKCQQFGPKCLIIRLTQTFLIVVLHLRFVSITLVFVNKTLLSGGSSLNAPLFITWYQCAVSTPYKWF